MGGRVSVKRLRETPERGRAGDFAQVRTILEAADFTRASRPPDPPLDPAEAELAAELLRQAAPRA
jgi:hypothetical protein